MKRFVLATATILIGASAAIAQAPQQVVQCRPLAAGDFLGPNDSIVGTGGNTQVCSVVMVKATTQAAYVSPASAPAAPRYSPRPMRRKARHNRVPLPAHKVPGQQTRSPQKSTMEKFGSTSRIGRSRK